MEFGIIILDANQQIRNQKEKAMAKIPYKVSMIGIIAAAAMPLFAATTRYVVPSGLFRIA